MRHHLPLLLCALAACATGTTDEPGETDTDVLTESDTEALPAPGSAGTSTGDEIPDPSVCDEEYSFCGDILIPADFTGTPRSLAVALYTTVPPAGPPNYTVISIDAPSMKAGERYPVRVQPMLETGDYFIWVNLYMEGGGTWLPVNDVDYTGVSAASITFDGTSYVFDDITVAPASGW